MTTVKAFISHDVRDSDLAGVLGRVLGRITLGQIETWYSSDSSAVGGITPGSIWLDDIRKRLHESRALVVVLTPRSLSKPWILFEAGFAAANPECEVIPVAAGIDSLGAVPYPLAMYQIFQITDYDSVKKFAAKLLARYAIQFDEEMAKPVLQASVGELTRLTSSLSTGDDSGEMNSSRAMVDAIKQHIDRALLRLTESDEVKAARRTLSDEVYSVPVELPVGDQASTQYVMIGADTTVQNVLDKIYFMMRPAIPPFKYLEKWMLRDKKSGLNLILREVGSRVPASGIFSPGSDWEVVMLSRPYSPSDSMDYSRWYRK